MAYNGWCTEALRRALQRDQRQDEQLRVGGFSPSAIKMVCAAMVVRLTVGRYVLGVFMFLNTPQQTLFSVTPIKS